MTAANGAPRWSVVNISLDTSDDGGDEPLGTKEKFWVLDPDGIRWLFKYARDKGGVVRGEDWAEWAVHLLGELLGIPTAVVRPATCQERRGIVSRSVVVEGERLEHGNELLARVDPHYNVEASRANPRYTVDGVRHALADIGPPRGRADLADFTAFDVWAGYVILDAWVAGRDRHHENWGAITDGSKRWLAPSFDHGNALGFQEPPERHAALASDPAQLGTWARRGRSPHFPGKPPLVSVALEALTLASPDAAPYWLGRLQAVDMDSVAALLDTVPWEVLSDPSRRFCLQLLELNRGRLLDVD